MLGQKKRLLSHNLPNKLTLSIHYQHGDKLLKRQVSCFVHQYVDAVQHFHRRIQIIAKLNIIYNIVPHSILEQSEKNILRRMVRRTRITPEVKAYTRLLRTETDKTVREIAELCVISPASVLRIA